MNRGWRAAYVKQWRVFSGLDRNETICDPGFPDLKAYLPYAQAILDLNEIHARQLAIVPPDGFPESHTNTDEKAIAELKAKMEALCAQSYAALSKETDAFVEATNFGQNKKKTRQLAAEIAQRLRTTPEPTPFGAPIPAPATANPVPGAGLPSVSPSGKKEPGANLRLPFLRPLHRCPAVCLSCSRGRETPAGLNPRPALDRAGVTAPGYLLFNADAGRGAG